MKVCIISSIFYPYARGGAEQVVYTQAQEFANQGNEVLVVTCAPFQGWRSFAGEWGSISLMATDRRLDSHKITDPVIRGNPLSSVAIRVFRFTPLNLFTIFNIARYSWLLRLFWHILDMFNLHTYLVARRILKKEKPDLVITRNLKGLGYTIPLAIRSTFHVPRSTIWFHSLHDLGLLHPRGYMEWGKEAVIRRPMFLVKIYRAITRQLFGSPSGIVAPSQFVLDEYIRCGFFSRSQKIVIPNPVIMEGYRKLQEVTGSYKKLPISNATSCNITQPHVTLCNPNLLRFLYLGQLEPYKGLRMLLRAWKEFVVEHPDAELEIAGQGSMQKEIKRAGQDLRGVRYKGFVPHDQISAALNDVHFLIMPSLAYETFGLVVIESFSAGVPVIASRLGALPELIQEETDGFLFNPGDENDLLNTINRALTIPWSKLSANAKKSAARFTADQHINKLQGFFEALMKA